jgi:hypothetical protein
MLAWAILAPVISSKSSALPAAMARWFRKAADQGLADAQFQLGTFYQFGQGVLDAREHPEQGARLPGRAAARRRLRQGPAGTGLCLCSACAGNVAMFYVKKPTSK